MCALFSILYPNPVSACQFLAEQASIEPVMEGCVYIGFIVQLQDFTFERYLKLHKAVSGFECVIEKRIEAQDFACLYIHPASTAPVSAGVPRVVFDPRGRVLYKWPN